MNDNVLGFYRYLEGSNKNIKAGVGGGVEEDLG